MLTKKLLLTKKVVIKWEFTCLVDWVCAGGGCVAAIAARSRCGWECGEFLYGWRLSLRLKGAVYGSYVRPAILYGSETWCLEETWEFYKGHYDP